MDHALMLHRLANSLACGRVPQPRSIVFSSSDNPPTVRAELRRRHRALVLHRLADELAR